MKARFLVASFAVLAGCTQPSSPVTADQIERSVTMCKNDGGLEKVTKADSTDITEMCGRFCSRKLYTVYTVTAVCKNAVTYSVTYRD